MPGFEVVIQQKRRCLPVVYARCFRGSMETRAENTKTSKSSPRACVSSVVFSAGRSSVRKLRVLHLHNVSLQVGPFTQNSPLKAVPWVERTQTPCKRSCSFVRRRRRFVVSSTVFIPSVHLGSGVTVRGVVFVSNYKR